MRPLVALLLVLLALPRAGSAQSVGFRASLTPDTVYVGQQATYELTVTLPAEVRQRLRRNPEFVPPEARAMLAYDLPVVRPPAGGGGTETHTFRRALFPLTAGRYPIPPARLSYTLPQSPSFFSREEERTLRSESRTLVVIDPPAAGRPASWGGAVGRWKVSARLHGAAPRVGDPLVLTLRVEGTGNVTLLSRPPLALDWATVVAADERVSLDSTPTALRGAKEFDWLVTPQQAGERGIRTLGFDSFDPETRRYLRPVAEPLAIRVAPGTVVALDARSGRRPPPPPLDLAPMSLAPARGDLLSTAALWIFVTAPLPWLLIAWRRRPRRAPRTPSVAERLAARDPLTDAELREAFAHTLAQRTGIRLADVTVSGALAGALKREGVTEETARAAEQWRERLDAATWGPDRASDDTSAAETKTLLDRIAAEARRRAPSLLLLVALVTSSTIPLLAQQELAAEVASAVAIGRTAYQSKDFDRAKRAFGRAAALAPYEAALWANAGTAAWQAADTASAVIGWQRALRLSPLDGAVRARLDLVRAPQDRGYAWVPPIPGDILLAVALLLWCLAWLLAAWRTARGRGALPALLWALPALGCLVLGLWANERATARGLAVVVLPAPVRSLPALGAEAGAVPLIGEVVAVVERRGVWSRVRLDADRAGWIPTERLARLSRD